MRSKTLISHCNLLGFINRASSISFINLKSSVSRFYSKRVRRHPSTATDFRGFESVQRKFLRYDTYYANSKFPPIQNVFSTESHQTVQIFDDIIKFLCTLLSDTKLTVPILFYALMFAHRVLHVFLNDFILPSRCSLPLAVITSNLSCIACYHRAYCSYNTFRFSRPRCPSHSVSLSCIIT